MKETFTNIRRAGLRALVGSLALLALLSFVLPQAAQASTAANTVIRNEVTVTYQDTASTPMTPVSSHVDITVTYVCAAPVFLTPTPSDQITDPNVPANYTYTITSKGNGPDTYNLSTSGASYHLISGATFGFYQGTQITTLTLGATTAAAAALSTDNSITIPNDGGTANGEVNNIKAGDTIVITIATVDHVYTVNSVTDGGNTIGGTSTITISGTFGVAIPAGTLINERQTFDLRVTPGTVSASATTLDPPTITVTANATGGCTAASDETITTVRVATLTITKEVTTDDTCNSGWATSGSFPPGDTVCYRITVQNRGNSNAIAATVTDPMPLYTTYVTGSTLLNAVPVSDVTGVSKLVSGLLVDDVAGRIPSGSVGTGVLPPYTTGPAGEAIIIFKVTIN
jgi:uncharacterized repeat protein (TIGR01451 family)